MNTKKLLPYMMALVPLWGVTALACAAQTMQGVTGDAAGAQGGQVVTPPSTIARPEDQGRSARTHFYFWQPTGDAGQPNSTMEPKKSGNNEDEKHEEK
jgi:hypothetical protein